MKVSVIAHPNSKKPRIETNSLGILNVYVNQPPLQGKANATVIEALAEYFKIKRYQIKLIKGERSKQKIFKIEL